MKSADVLVIGGGPGGLGAAIEAAKMGASVALADENPRMGGQLYKQIHKFFGSEAHYAGVRGFEIAKILIGEAKKAGVTLLPETRALGLLDRGEVALLDVSGQKNARQFTLKAKTVVLATGAKENAVPFPGWTLPGVMTAGAAQTLANIYGVLPGRRILILGSGNVGLIVGYQLMQAGARVEGIVEALHCVSGYAVHAAKVQRAGVPLYLGHTVVAAHGEGHVRGAVVARVDKCFRPVEGTERAIDCDTVLLAAGLSPRTEIAAMFGCEMTLERRLGGLMPLHDEGMRTSNPAVYVSGDLAGVEEASTALDEGRLAGISAAIACGYAANGQGERIESLKASLAALRSGPHGRLRREAKESILSLSREKGIPGGTL
ncbi:MAG: FAD-dependent oxidoreductase [Bacillota bacterium]